MHLLLVSLAVTLSAPRLGTPWRPVGPGVEVTPAAELGGDAAWAARVVLVDPARVEFFVRYDPRRPTLAEWRGRFPQALAVLNGSFYSVEGNSVRPTCDLVADGVPFRGAGCRRQDALFFGARARPPPAQGAMVSRTAPRARLIPPQDFRADEWHEALKSFPALVRAGSVACSGAHYCAESSRTAAIAQMKDGRILLFASQWPAVRREVGRWMAEQLGVIDALNLDGGPEATLALKGETVEEAIGTQGVGLPIVILIVAR